MLTEGKCLDLWADVRRDRNGYGPTTTEHIVRFARLVEAAALRNARKRTRNMIALDIYYDLFSEARRCEKAAREETQ